jgi:hypothetical protein
VVGRIALRRGAALAAVSAAALALAGSPGGATPKALKAGEYAVTVSVTNRVPGGTRIDYSHGNGRCVKDLHAGSATAHSVPFPQHFQAFVAESEGACANVAPRATFRVELREPKKPAMTTTLVFTEDGPRAYRASCSGTEITCNGGPGLRPATVEMVLGLPNCGPRCGL